MSREIEQKRPSKRGLIVSRFPINIIKTFFKLIIEWDEETHYRKVKLKEELKKLKVK